MKLIFFWRPVSDQLVCAQFMPIALQHSISMLEKVQFSTCTKLRSQSEKLHSIKRQPRKLAPLKLQSTNEQLSNLQASTTDRSWLSP